MYNWNDSPLVFFNILMRDKFMKNMIKTFLMCAASCCIFLCTGCGGSSSEDQIERDGLAPVSVLGKRIKFDPITTNAGWGTVSVWANFTANGTSAFVSEWGIDSPTYQTNIPYIKTPGERDTAVFAINWAIGSTVYAYNAEMTFTRLDKDYGLIGTATVTFQSRASGHNWVTQTVQGVRFSVNVP